MQDSYHHLLHSVYASPVQSDVSEYVVGKSQATRLHKITLQTRFQS